jgi:hypothetical protein
VAADIATKESKHAIQSIFLWHGRYRVIEGRPEHTSATCFVYRAVDEEDRDESNHPKRVALKLMRYKSQFLRELKARQFGFDSEYVVNVIATYPTYDATTGPCHLSTRPDPFSITLFYISPQPLPPLPPLI